ncbi:MOP flippase family protein [Pontibacter harenae]|uniref:MOP flippase family protein n=1 Tax=Pontibacter harenae TaxID=2894083 RepID=UPI001E45EC8E|nr:MOP flippase family protein [Pontibacter harenae]MCC9166589.1 MOP flippase family protein [Pontibacter harenae]
MGSDIKAKAIKGVKWTTASTLVLALTSILRLSILSRYLDKSDFGLMAIVLLILGFMELFQDMGLSTAILHKQNINKNEYSSLYWTNILFSFLLYLIIVLISPLASEFYSESSLLNLLPIMGVSLLFSSLGRQFQVIEQKNLNFKRVGIIEISTSILSLAVAILLAVYKLGVYSLVYSSLFKALTSNCLYFLLGIVQGNKIQFRYRFQEVKPFIRIGVYQTGGQIINYVNRDLDILLIGKFFGSETLGGYSLAKQLVLRPYSVINPILTRVAAPVLSRYQYELDSLRNNYLKLVNLVSSVNIPIYICIILFAPLIIKIMYGADFINIVMLVRILSICMMIRSVANPIGSLVVATGRTDLEFFWNLFTLAVIPFSIITASQHSIEWVAISITVTMALLIVPNWWFLTRRMIAINLTTYLYALVPTINFIKVLKKSL